MSDLYLPVSVVTGIVAWAMVARWYVLPWANSQSLRDALTPLVLVHAFRYVGLAFLVPGVTAQPLDPRFALPAAWGDLAAAVLALVALLALRSGWVAAGALVWAFNLFGAADLVNAVFQGLRHTVDGHLGATWFIPALFVPMLLVGHVVIALVQLGHPVFANGQESPVTRR